MRNIRIVIDPYSSKNKSFIDGSVASAYGTGLSDFNVLDTVDFAFKFFEVAAYDLNDTFKLTVVSEKFDYNLLKLLKGTDWGCADIKGEPFEIPTSAVERIKTLTNLCSKYGTSPSGKLNKANIYTEFDIPFNSNLATKSSLQEADICFFKTEEAMVMQKSSANGCICCAVNSVSSASFDYMDGKYSICLPQDQMKSFLEGYLEKYVLAPYVKVLVASLKGKTRNMSPQDIETYVKCAYTSSVVRCRKVPTLEVGDSYKIETQVLPTSCKLPKLTVQSGDSSVLSVSDMTVTAMSEGIVSIKILRDDDIAPCLEQDVTVLNSNFAKEIEFCSSNISTGVNHSIPLNLNITPSDAGDASLIQYVSSDTRVVRIDSSRNAMAVGPGRATITAKSKRATCVMRVEVKPLISNVTMSDTNLSMTVGNRKHLRYSISPSNAFNTDVKVTSSSPGIASARIVNKEVIVDAVGPGVAKVVITPYEGSGSALMTVTVGIEDSLEGNNLVSAFISIGFLSLLFAAVMFIATLFGWRYSIVGIAGCVLGILSGIVIKVKKRNKRDNKCAIAFLVISSVVMLLTILEYIYLCIN